MIEGTCDRCRHWLGNQIHEDYGKPMRDALKDSDGPFLTWQCTSEKFVKGYGIPESERPRDGAVVESDEGWGIETGPDFGCIHWTSKTP